MSEHEEGHDLGLTVRPLHQCGLEKPACARCRKAGLACEGYDTDRIFVVSDPSGRYNASQAARSSARSADRHQVHLSSGIANLRLLTQPAYESRCIDLFWEAYFPSGRPLPESLSRSYMCSWTETAQKLYTQDDSLRYALWANCLLMTGRRYHDAWMLREGPRMYGKALAGLRSSLSISGRVRRDTLIATVKLLTMFEVRSLTFPLHLHRAYIAAQRSATETSGFTGFLSAGRRANSGRSIAVLAATPCR